MKRDWRKQEEALARRRGGKRQPYSGGGLLKEDVTDAVGLAQCKVTTGQSITIKLQDLKTLRRHAEEAQRLPYAELKFVRSNPLDNLRVYLVFPAEFDRFFPKEGER